MSFEQIVLVIEFAKKVVRGEEVDPDAMAFMVEFMNADIPCIKKADYEKAREFVSGEGLE